MSRPYNPPPALRHRSRWEAVDAGLLMWRENFSVLLIVFALPLWICAFALRIIPDNFRYLSWLILWLLRPLFERPVLHVISVRFFEKSAGIKRLCRGLFKTMFRGLAGDLTWRRFSPLRAAMMPVRTLEALKFRQTGERRRTLKKGRLGFCSILTLWALTMEVVLLGGGIFFCYIMLELIQGGLFNSIKDIFESWELLIYAAWCINSMLVGSLYVCMGFSLYLNCRVELEGWDLEILFRGLAEKNKRKNPSRVLVMVFFALALLLPCGNTAAEEAIDNGQGAVSNGQVPLDALAEILASPDFGGMRDGWGIRLKQDRDKTQPDLNLNINPFLEKIKQTIAFILRMGLIGLIVFLAVLIFLRIRKSLGGRSIYKKNAAIQAIQGADNLSPQTLLAQSLDYFSCGQLRQAWGLCIAALFRALTLYRGIAFPPGATEYDCLNVARHALPSQADSLSIAVNHWIAYAYAGRLPPQDSYMEAVAYCRGIAALPSAEQPAEQGQLPGAAHE